MGGRRRSILALYLLASSLASPRLASASETVTHTYNARGQLVKVTRSGSVNNGVNACYAYDKADNRSNVTVLLSSVCTVSTLPSFGVSDVTVTEGGTIGFTVTKTGSTSSTITVNYSTANGTAAAGSDYTSTSGVLSFAPGDTSKPVNVATANDSAIESPETVFLNLTAVSPGGVIGDEQGVGTIQDNEGFSVSDPSQPTEAGQLGFVITKVGTTSSNITLAYQTSDGTATANSDYSPKYGTISFAPGDTSRNIYVGILPDSAIEANETVHLNLYNASLGTILDSQGTGTITDDDSSPSFAVNDVTVAEGGVLTFTITRSGPSSGSYSVNYATSNGSASSGTDYTAASSVITFASGVTTQTRSVTTLEDVAFEGAEQLNFNLSGATGGATISDAVGVGTISDNDTVASGPHFSINDPPAVVEGGVLVFTVTKTGSGSASVNYATQTGAAGSGDFTATSGTLSFTSSQTTKQINVQTTDNVLEENTETMRVILSGASGANISDGIGVGTILDDDDGCTNCLQSGGEEPEAESAAPDESEEPPPS